MGTKTDTVLKMIQSLEKIYGVPQKPKAKVPIVDQIVIHVMAHQEKEEDVQKAYESLVQEFVDWNEVRVSHPREIQEIIEPYLKKQINEKAHKIKDILYQIFNFYNRLDLEFLWDKDFSEIQKLIQHIHGLGQEFLAKFICYIYFQEDAPLSPAFFRIGKRMNLWEENANPSILKKNFIKEIGLENFSHLKILLFLHGESICCSKAYDCSHCTLMKQCQKGKKESSVSETKSATKGTENAEESSSKPTITKTFCKKRAQKRKSSALAQRKQERKTKEKIPTTRGKLASLKRQSKKAGDKHLSKRIKKKNT